MPTIYKHFTQKEAQGIEPSLMLLLDSARDKAGIPFIIISGLRTIAQNNASGGVSESAHLADASGLSQAVDLACTASVNRFKMVKALLDVGFNRIGIYQNHIHADESSALPQSVMWYADSTL